MLNVSAAPQSKPSVNSPTAISSPGADDTQEPKTEEFAKVLQREVSETTDNRENAATTSDSTENTITPANSDIVPTGTMDAASTSCLINTISNLFIEAANADTTDLSLLSQDLATPDTLTAASILPTALSMFSQNSLFPQDNKQVTSPGLLNSEMLQQRFAQTILTTNNFIYSPADFWQSLDKADFAAFDELLPFSSGINEAIEINTEESIFPAHNESLSTKSFGLSNLPSVPSPNSAPQNVQIDIPVGQPKWGVEFAQKIVWVTTQQHQVAEIHLNPAHLGPVEVMLSITQDQATAQFLSPHLAVREAIEEALPRLREMMAENGIQLGNVMVGADSFQQENKQQQTYKSAKDNANMMGTRTETASQIETAVLPSKHNGMVNTYA